MASWVRLIGLSVPLTILKSWLYALTTISSSVFVLLPIALITYNNYYHALIPRNSSFVVPLSFTNTPDGRYITSSVISPSGRLDALGLGLGLGKWEDVDLELSYVFEVCLYVVCKPKTELYSIDKISYAYVFTDTNTTNTESESGAGGVPEKHEIVVTDDDDNRVFHTGSFVLNCDPYSIYATNNHIIPYNLRFYIAPHLTLILQSTTMRLNHFEIRGDKVSQLGDFQVRLGLPEGSVEDFVIDDNESFLKVNVVWTGFRYYLVKYYYSCYLVGTAFFFGVTAGFGIVVSYAMLLLNNRASVNALNGSKKRL
ncbi:hypothetical protein Cantr_00036 [Candida viswanathii]|uniref:Seipin n=1 Tax=Candida viswanathii TaxID=5486 RepID=A0A367YEV4_9ASCO|nr:hypothetical protein Cantr_00036 [Candida viswanathii]